MCCTFPCTQGINYLLFLQTWSFLPGFPFGVGSQVTRDSPSESGHLCVTRCRGWMSPCECQEMPMDKEQGEKAKIGIPRLCCSPGVDKYNLLYTQGARACHGQGSNIAVCTDQPSLAGNSAVPERRSHTDDRGLIPAVILAKHCTLALWDLIPVAGTGWARHKVPNTPKNVCKLLLRWSSTLK